MDDGKPALPELSVLASKAPSVAKSISHTPENAAMIERAHQEAKIVLSGLWKGNKK